MIYDNINNPLGKSININTSKNIHNLRDVQASFQIKQAQDSMNQAQSLKRAEQTSQN
jgi:hypothetical protein